MTGIDALIERYALANAFSHSGKAQAGSIIGKLIAEDPKYREQMKELAPKIAKIVSEVNKMKIEEQEKKLLKVFPEFFEKKESKHEEKTLKELPNAEQGKVVLRLAPFPSGPLHIGNAKTYLLNALYAEKYEGKLLLIIDDTIGSEEKQILKEAYDLIPEGLKWLGVNWDGPIIYKSDRLETYYKYAAELIKKGDAYVCECSAETLRKNRAEGKECIHRKQSVKGNLEKWEAMHKGKYKEGQVSLRLKTSMTNPNPAFRDRVLFRISDRAHPRVGKKYRVWPMLEFSWAIDDHLLGVTHVIRGKDLVMETEMCKFIWDILKWPYPTITHTGLVRLEGIKLSKSKAQKEVLSGAYAGWDDPAKMVCDFFCQPEIPVPLNYFSTFQDIVVKASKEGESLRERIFLLLPVYRIKWCCIMLNDFLPMDNKRRGFSNQEVSGSRRAVQLKKARRYWSDWIKSSGVQV